MNDGLDWKNVAKDMKVNLRSLLYVIQKVVDDFNNAIEIYIVTFNISKYRDGKLIKELEAACKNGTKVTIVTNIPKRFSSYYKDCYALYAHYVIQDYLGILNAEKFNMHLSAFFNL